MYEGWHIEFTAHARRRLFERLVAEHEVLQAIAVPDSVRTDTAHGGKLLSKYLPDWDRILVVAVDERVSEGMLIVKTVLWSKAK